MVTRKKPSEVKNIPGVSFLLPFQLRFSISSPETMVDEIRNNKDFISSKFFQKELLKDLKVKNTDELIKESGAEYEFKKFKDALTAGIIDSLNIDLSKNYYSSLSDWGVQKFETYEKKRGDGDVKNK
jgi:hypothetical protein